MSFCRWLGGAGYPLAQGLAVVQVEFPAACAKAGELGATEVCDTQGGLQPSTIHFG